MPEKIFKKIKEVPHQWKYCFYTALIVGLLAHMYKITGWIPNWDSLVFRYDSQNMIGLGRWFLPVVCSFSSFFDLPFLNGIIAILFHCLGAVCIVRIFNVKKDITAGLIGGITASFPTVTSVMMYNYVVDGYSIAFFFACLAALYLTKEKPSYVTGIIFITLSVATYQAYISVTATLLLLYLVYELIFRKKDMNAILKKTVGFSFAGIAGLSAYYLMLIVILSVSKIELLNYQGFGESLRMTNVNVFSSVYMIFNSVKTYFFDFSKGVNLYNVLNVIIVALILAVYISFVIKNKIYKKWYKIIALIAIMLLIPAGASLLVFIDPDVVFHNLMKMGYFILYIAFALLYENVGHIGKKYVAQKMWTVFIIGCLICLNQIVISNVSYHMGQMAYEKSYGALIRITDRIEQTENSENSNEILVIGALKGSEQYSVVLPPEITGITESYILRADDESVNQSVFCSAINDYCGKQYKFISGDRKKEFLEKEEIKAMKEWPHKDSVKIYDNVIIIKLGAESE